MVNASAMFLALLLSAQSLLAQTPPPDTILHNGKIFTSNAERPWVEALAIRGERIVAVGASNVILQLAGANTRVVDLAARTVVPGFNDAHWHQGLRTLPRTVVVPG